MTANDRCVCGIDIGKRKHAACILNSQGEVLANVRFANDAQGFACLRQHLQAHGQGIEVLVGMEATGHYWYALHDQIGRWNYPRIVLNPLQTAQQAKNAIRKHKSDTRDAWHIACLVQSGQGKPAVIPGELAMTCRQLTRLWYTLMGQRTRINRCCFPNSNGCGRNSKATSPMSLVPPAERACVPRPRRRTW
jgi:transposase